MRKILLSLCCLPLCSFAASLDVNTLSCGSLKINSATTLANLQSSCKIKSQKEEKGEYTVEFTDTTTNKSVSCHFPSNTPTALVNSCK